MIKRLFDIFFSLTGIILLFPLFVFLSLLVAITSKGPIFFKQKRVGRNEIEFDLYKFRSMVVNADSKGFLTVGEKDKRITSVGFWLRKFKLDELPQLFNILNGTMSFVGPRPEVKKYVNLYTDNQKKVFCVRPGLTDPASIAYFNENKILESYPDPEEVYIKKIMPEKLAINLNYIQNRSLWKDLKIILNTVMKIFA